MSAYPLVGTEGETREAVLVFKELRRVRKLANKIMGRQAIYTFDKAVQAGVLTREHCVCLTGALHEGQAVAADLARSCVLLDVSDRGTPDALSRLVPT